MPIPKITTTLNCWYIADTCMPASASSETKAIDTEKATPMVARGTSMATGER